jgi:hypothetical protein
MKAGGKQSQQTTRRYIPEDSTLRGTCCLPLKFGLYFQGILSLFTLTNQQKITFISSH